MDATAITIFFCRQAEKKPRIVANKIAKTNFLQKRHGVQLIALY